MAATRPIRVSDLIKKYGWEIMPYLSNLGPTLLSEAQILFVDSGATNALDADDGYHGHSLVNPLATIDYAIGLCTAGERSVIIVAPGHNDELGDAQMDFDVSDVTLIGIGVGTNKPRIDFDHANSSVDIGANNIHIRNITLMPSITDILIGVDIEAGVTGTILEDCDWAEGESANDEFIVGLALKAGCTDTKVTNCLFRTKAAAAGCTAGVKLTGASDNVIVEHSRFIGNWSTAAIHNDSGACTDLLIDDCTMKVKDGEPGIEVVGTTTGIIRNVCIESTGATVNNMIVAADMSWFNNWGVTVDGAAAELIGGGEVSAALNTAVTQPPTAKSLFDILHKDGSYTYDNTTDSLEAIADAVGAISSPTDVTGAISSPPTEKSLQDILHADGSFTFDNTTDSLEAIADAVAALNLSSAVSATPTARSIQDILEKDGSSNFDDATDSLEAISDQVGGFSGDGGAQVDDSIKASLDLAHTDLDAILADTISISGGTLPADPTANSLAAYIASGGTALGQELPDSMSLVDIIGDFTGAHDGTVYDDNIFACLKKMSTYFADGDGDFATGTAMPSNVSIYDVTGGFSGDGGAAQDDSIKASLDLAHTDLDAIIADIGTLVNTAGTATIGGIFGDFANSSLVTRLGNIQTEADKIGTIVNAGGTATIGGIFGDFANVTLVTKLTNLQTDADNWGTLSNTAGTAELGAMLGDFANTTLVARHTTLNTTLTYQEQCVEKVATSTDDDLFDVTGEVLILSLVGIVTTTPIGAVQNRIKITMDADNTYDYDFSTEVDTNADAVGTRYVFSAANPAVLTPLSNGAAGSGQPMYPWACVAGVIEQAKNGGDAGTTGQINWYITYRPLSSDGAISAAA